MKITSELLRESRVNLNSAMCNFIKGVYPENKLEGKLKKHISKLFILLIDCEEKFLRENE